MDVLTIQWGWIGGKRKAIVTPPIPPTPVIQRVEPRRWPGPSILLYDDNDTYWKRQRREEEEILLLK